VPASIQPPSEVRYSNLFARLFLRSFFENQWVIPEPPPALVSRFLRWYERRRMRIDLGGFAIDRPIFVLSLPRCGSSMLQDLVCTHPGVAYLTNLMDIFRHSSICAAEHFRRRFGLDIRGERFLRDSIMVDGGSPADPVATWADLFGEDYFEIPDSLPDPGRLDDAAVERIRRRLLEVLWCFGQPCRRFFCKTPMLLPYALVLKRIFPDARFIHLLRDPRQGANSMVKIHRICNEQLAAIRQRTRRPLPPREFVPYPRLPQLPDYLARFGAADLRTTAHLWNDALEFIDSARSRLGQLHEVRYEDILARPDEEMAAIFDFCQLPQPDADNTAYREKLAGVGVVRHRNAYSGFDTVSSVCACGMARFGYPDAPQGGDGSV
jgi:hypothetical protein